MKSYAFQVVIEEDRFEDGHPAFHAYCPSLKGCHTWGHTYSEALSNIQEVIEIYVADLVEGGETIDANPKAGIIELSSPSVVVNV